MKVIWLGIGWSSPSTLIWLYLRYYNKNKHLQLLFFIGQTIADGDAEQDRRSIVLQTLPLNRISSWMCILPSVSTEESLRDMQTALLTRSRKGAWHWFSIENALPGTSICGGLNLLFFKTIWHHALDCLHKRRRIHQGHNSSEVLL